MAQVVADEASRRAAVSATRAALVTGLLGVGALGPPRLEIGVHERSRGPGPPPAVFVIPPGCAEGEFVGKGLLARMGLRAEDLLAAPGAGAAAPTDVHRVHHGTGRGPPTGTRVYLPYWKRIDAKWARHLDEPAPSQIRAFVAEMKANDIVTSRSNYRGGVCAERHMIGAFAAQHAETDRLITAAKNPPQKGNMPRPPGLAASRADNARLAEINICVAATGDNPALDSLFVRFQRRDGGPAGRRPAAGGPVQPPLDVFQHDCDGDDRYGEEHHEKEP